MEVIDRHRPSERYPASKSRVDPTFNYAQMRKDLEVMRFTPLHWAIHLVCLAPSPAPSLNPRFKNSPADCTELLEAGAKHDVPDSRHRTPLGILFLHLPLCLHCFVQIGHAPVVILILLNYY